eukprot:7340078-Pyramimonas_sp.AAC.1
MRWGTGRGARPWAGLVVADRTMKCETRAGPRASFHVGSPIRRRLRHLLLVAHLGLAISLPRLCLE